MRFAVQQYILETEKTVKLAKEALELGTTNSDLMSAEYNAAMDSEVGASWISRIFAVVSTKASTFATATNGRAVLNTCFSMIKEFAGNTQNGVVLVPDTSWPMIRSQLKHNGLKPAFYNMERGSYADNIRAQLEAQEAAGNSVAGVYVNSPHNPTGQILTTKDFHEIFAVLNEYNSPERAEKRGYKIGLIMDNPYPHACKETVRQGQRGLDVGLESFTHDQPTPWVMPVSFSKIVAARPGFTITASHPYYAANLRDRLMETFATAYNPPLFRAMNTVMSPSSDGIVLDYFAELREQKYAQNSIAAHNALGDRVVDGDPGMIILAEFDPEKYIGKIVYKHDGSPFLIEDANDFLEYAGNMGGAVAVNNSDGNGPWMVRYAAAELPAQFSAGIQAFMASATVIEDTPKAEPNPATPLAPRRDKGEPVIRG